MRSFVLLNNTAIILKASFGKFPFRLDSSIRLEENLSCEVYRSFRVEGILRLSRFRGSSKKRNP